MPAPSAPEPEDDRFLLKQNSFLGNMREMFRDIFKPAKVPELKLESKPIPVKSIWSQENTLKQRLTSFGIHAAVIGILCLPFWRPVRNQVQKLVQTEIFMPDKPPPLMPMMRKLSGGGTPHPEAPKLIQTPKPQPIVAPTAMVPLQEAMAAPSFGAIGPIAGPPGAGGGAGGGSGGEGNGTGGGDCVGPNCVDAGAVASAPVPIFQPDPDYSDAARKAKFQGTCIVDIIVNADGSVSDPKVTQPLGLGLDQKAIEAVMKWKFIPAKDKNGRPIRALAEVQVNFRLF